MSSNLPPGCRESDIPGNRPEDIQFEAELEAAIDYLTNAKPQPGEMMLAVVVGVKAIEEARKYAIAMCQEQEADSQMAAAAGHCPYCKPKDD